MTKDEVSLVNSLLNKFKMHNAGTYLHNINWNGNSKYFINSINPAHIGLQIQLIEDYFNKMLINFLERIESVEFAIYPLKSNYGNELGEGNLIGDLESLYNIVKEEKSQDFEKFEFYLRRLIWYQVINSFWDNLTDGKPKEIYEKMLQYELDATNKLTTMDTLLKSTQDKATGVVNLTFAKAYDDRCEKIKTSIIIWSLILGVEFILPIILLVIYHRDLQINNLSDLRSIGPIIIILGIFIYFTISQYNKERNLLELYKFKSIIASTISIYKGEFKEDGKSDFIRNSIDNLYNPPNIGNIKQKDEVSHPLDVARKIVDMIYNKFK
jgi:hypothetical protein